jgi:membrane protein implicated in regulation of membrane protease activity
MDINIFWWHWLVFGLILVAAELVAPGGFFIIFFGVAAVIVGLLASVGAAGPLWMQVLLFSVCSVGSLWIFRRSLLAWFEKDKDGPPVDSLVGKACTSVEELAPGARGHVEFRGTSWTARNASDAAIGRDARCRVVRVEGLTLHVEPEGR